MTTTKLEDLNEALVAARPTGRCRCGRPRRTNGSFNPNCTMCDEDKATYAAGDVPTIPTLTPEAEAARRMASRTAAKALGWATEISEKA